MSAGENENDEATRWAPALPPWRTGPTGDPRRVGVELEFIGIDPHSVGRAVVETLGGELDVQSRYEVEVHGDSAGPWRVELDWEYLKARGREVRDGAPRPWYEEVADDLITAGAEAVVPVEVVSPPLPLERLADAERLLRALRALGAQGTQQGLTYAFGLQLNPELPRLDAPTILAYLRAFACLHGWLVKAGDMDWTRRLTGYAAPYPREYVRRLLDPGYAPTLGELIDDYLADNPTRNRALDCLPLFCELDEERLRRVVDDPRVKPRPTFHYRLPNSEVDDPSWGLARPWSHWLQVEHLAADPERLAEVMRRYDTFLADLLDPWIGDWAEIVDAWLLPTADLESE